MTVEWLLTVYPQEDKIHKALLYKCRNCDCWLLRFTELDRSQAELPRWISRVHGSRQHLRTPQRTHHRVEVRPLRMLEYHVQLTQAIHYRETAGVTQDIATDPTLVRYTDLTGQ